MHKFWNENSERIWVSEHSPWILLFIYEVKVNSLVSSLLGCHPSLPILSTDSKGIEEEWCTKCGWIFSAHFYNAQVLHFVKFGAFFFLGGGGVKRLGFFWKFWENFCTSKVGTYTGKRSDRLPWWNILIFFFFSASSK